MTVKAVVVFSTLFTRVSYEVFKAGASEDLLKYVLLSSDVLIVEPLLVQIKAADVGLLQRGVNQLFHFPIVLFIFTFSKNSQHLPFRWQN